MSATEAQVAVNTNLQKQDLKNLDVCKLTALSPEVISRQATINIGTIGHVAHGKSTVVKAISGVQTVRFKNELERNITIKLERISRNRILELLKSPALLREHEEREEQNVQRLAREREIHRQTWRAETNEVAKVPITPSLSMASLVTSDGRRCTSLTPSSGYESLYENASSCGSEYGTPTSKTLLGKKPPWSLQRLQQDQFKQATKRRWSDYSGSKSSKAKRRKGSPPEYIVEYIESLESINGKPVFLVKWLNYPDTQNTWESLDNVVECNALEEFIEYQMLFFEEAIAAITREIEAQIESESLHLTADQVSVLELDKYEPMALKTELLLLAQFREAGSRSQREPEKIRKRAIELMLRKPFYYMRNQQLKDLQAWEERMNAIEGEAPIKIENNVDLEVLDTQFHYIKESFAAPGVAVNDNFLIGCKCDEECTRTSRCCAKMADGIFAYDKRGRLRIKPGEAIYECNQKCSCDMTCNNRVIQHGRKNSLCLYKTPTGCGWGVRALQPIRRGEFVCEYVGEIVTVEEANERGKIYDAIGRTYLFDLDYNTTAESVYTIDAAMYGNISHFINHSCDPNLSVFPFWINNMDINMPRLAFFALRNINVGEELSFDYIRGNTDVQEHEYQNLSEAEKVSCRCGAENCRKVLF